MLLIHARKVTPRFSYIFKHICQRILKIEASFTTALEDFISYPGAKISYGKKPLGNELFFQSYGLLEQQGIESMDFTVRKWDETYGFFSVSSNSALPFDIFSASFYMLSRYEEYLPHVKDEMGRFMASESLAYKEGFLHQPVVDIWAYKFKEKLLSVFPDFVFPDKETIIHPVVEASSPFEYDQKGIFRSLIGYFDNLVRGKFRKIIERTQVLVGLKRDPLDTFKWIINTAKHSRFKLTVFFLLGESQRFEESLNTSRQKFKQLIKYVADYKEVGLIFSFGSLTNHDVLKVEKSQMEHITNRDLLSSMNADFVVNLPEVYRNLVELEVYNDFTMVFPFTPGFRAGTCTSFLFYDLDFEIKTPLLIHPATMTTSAFTMKYTSDIEKVVDNYLTEVEKVKGTFILIFSNRNFSSTPENKVWRKIFSEKLSDRREI